MLDVFARSNIPWDQILPLLVVFVFAPLIALGTHRITSMVFENAGLWSWFTNHESVSSSKKERLSSSRKKQTHMRRTDQVSDKRLSIMESQRYYPGLVNISGTYCFLNSTLQAMASLSYLQPYLDTIHARAENFDVPTPVLDALQDALSDINTPKSSPRAIRPIEIINALSTPLPGNHNRTALFSSREHQDAQELFQLISESVKNEAKAVDDEARRDRGLVGLSKEMSEREVSPEKGVFDGLTANRRSCVECGYTEAVMHFAFDNWQLAVPRATSCRLEDCLADYTRLEILTDCICRRCSMLATHKRLLAEVAKYDGEAAHGAKDHDQGRKSINGEQVQGENKLNIEQSRGMSSSKKKRAREARRLVARVKAALDEGRIEEDIKGVKMEKVFSRCSTKQAMIARPPPILALHLNRSLHYGTSGIKNTCRVLFPELLDLTPYTTSGQLSTLPSQPISTPSTPTPRRVLYRLSAVVCHYGTHSFGHYVSFRRKPRPPNAKTRWEPPTMRCPMGCKCQKCVAFGPIRYRDDEDEDEVKAEMPAYAASRWLRISDDSVEECGVERVLAESAGTFMLYYERVIMGDGVEVQAGVSEWGTKAKKAGATEDIVEISIQDMGEYVSRSTSSEETIKPLVRRENTKLAFGAGDSGARIVRSVYAGRSRDVSPSTISSREESVSAPPSRAWSESEEIADGTTHEVRSITDSTIASTPSSSAELAIDSSTIPVTNPIPAPASASLSSDTNVSFPSTPVRTPSPDSQSTALPPQPQARTVDLRA